METSDSGLPQELMSSEGDDSSATTTLMVTGLTADQLTLSGDAAQQATIQAVLQAAGHMINRNNPTLTHSNLTKSAI